MVLMASVVFTLLISSTGSTATIQETIPSNSGPNTALVTVCKPIVDIPNNPLAGLCGTIKLPSGSNSNSVTISNPVTVTAQPNQTVTLSSQTKSVSVIPSNGQSITISNQNGNTITAVTSSGQTITSSTITVSTGVTLTSTVPVNITSTTTQPVVITPQTGSSLTVSTNSSSTSSTLSLVATCPNNGIAVNGTCPTSTTVISPVCTASQLGNGYTVQGNTCVAPPPICSTSQITNGYTVNGNICSPPPAENVSITPIALITDNTGVTQQIPTDAIQFKLESFITSHTQNLNIDHGQITLSLKFKGKPNTFYQNNGTLFVNINSNSLHPNGVQWVVNGITDNNGEVLANIQTPSGIVNKYTLDVAQNANMISQPTNFINFTIDNVKIQNSKNGKSFHASGKQNAVSIQLDYDSAGIIKKNAVGNNIRGYPDDDIFKLVSSPTFIAGKQICQFNPSGRQSCGWMQDQTILGPRCYYCSASVYLENQGTEKLLGITNMFYTDQPLIPNYQGIIANIPWDSDIKIVESGIATTGNVQPISVIFHTPKIHKDYTYTCSGTNTCSANFP